MARGRGQLILHDEKLVGVVTYHVGDDDEKFLHSDPWLILDDDPAGETLYIRQLIAKDYPRNVMWRELNKGLKELAEEFKNIKQVKWMRAPASFRKKGLTREKPNVHYKSIRRERI